MNNFWKDLFRTIRHSFGRFLAIAGICALGVGFFGGLQMTCGSMKQAVTNFYNDTNMMDIRIVCNLGISDENIESFKQVDGVDGVMPAYETDILVNFGYDQSAVRVHSLPNNLDTNNKDYINQLILTDGAWPQNSSECVLSADAVLPYPPKLGDEIDILECSTGMDQTLNTKKLKVVGFVRSSYYVSNVQMGQSNLGKGIVNDFAYVPQSTFKDDYPYSEIFITVKDAKDYVTGTEDYQNLINEVMERLGETAPVQAEVRTASLKHEAQKELNKAIEEYHNQKNKAEEELNSNEEKLNEALRQIKEAEDPLLVAEELLNQEYALFRSAKDSVLGPLNETISILENALVEGLVLRDMHLANVDVLTEANAAVQVFSTVDAGLENIISELDTTIQIDNEIIALLYSVFDDPKPQVSFLNGDIEKANNLKSYSQEFYNALALEHSQSVYYEYKPGFDESFNSLSNNFDQKQWMCQGLSEESSYYLRTVAYPQREEATKLFDELEKPLIEATEQINAAKLEITINKDKVLDGFAQFYSAKQLAEQKFKDAEDVINTSQNQIDSIEANMFVMDRTKNMGAINFKNDSERMASIANVFPLIFLFVALLVALTSMTRMIEEERITIGTYKALGFSKLRVSNKYILYGVISSFVGSVVGLLILTQFLPFVIMFAYSIIYKLPIELPMPFNWTIGILSTLAGVILTIIATLMAAARILSLVPARLMIPIAPKAGKRILLEHVKPIWNVLTFNWKITFRNMFLYKKRLFMTLIGIAGCTALLLTGFGLHDSISDIMNKQFDEISLDNFKVTLNSEASQTQEDNLRNEIAVAAPSSSATLIHEEIFVATPEGHPNAPTIIAVPKDREQFQQMRLLQNRITKEKFILDDEGVYVSEKLASLMGVGVGDNITVYNQDLIGNAGDEEYKFKIAGIVENYIAHYIYMTPNVYKQYFNKECVFNNLIAKTSVSSDGEQNVIDCAKSNEIVKTAFFTTSTRDTYNTMLRSVNLVVVVLIVSAGLLAFVVLYNLININICERSREIATLKVLGTNRHEINMYIHRETFMLSFFGSILGLILGIFMEQFVITSAEVDMVMFGRTIYWWSFLISLGITLVFTIIVVLFMRKKLFSISMVESLKSVE